MSSLSDVRPARPASADEAGVRAGGPPASPLPRSSRRRRRRSRQSGVIAALTILSLIGLVPYLFVLITSLKTKEQFNESYFTPSLPFHWQNYSTAWTQIKPYFLSTIIVAVGTLVATIVLATTAAYVFARFEFPLRRVLLGLVAALLMIPNISMLIPLFIEMRDLGLLNTRLVLALPLISGSLVLGILLLRTYMVGIPQEIFDAARLDGAGNARMFTALVLPMSLPAIGTLALVTVLRVWNDFFWPLLTITDDRLRTVSVGLQFFRTQNGTDWGPLFAGYILASLPLLALFTFLSKYFLAGIQGGFVGGEK